MELKIQNVSKTYRNGHVALHDFSLTIKPGVLGLLGPNGAGKSTLMRILATITKPTSGIITLNGVDIIKSPGCVHECLGYLPQDFGVYPNLSALEFLEYMGSLKGLKPSYTRKRSLYLLELLNLQDVAKKPIGSYSGGMKQRVGIAQSLLNDPKLLIVDEPTVGLDPEERLRFRNLLSDLSGDRIVILSTHIVSDVESTASDLAILSRGRLIADDQPERLLEQIEGLVWECVVQASELPALRTHWNISNTIRRKDGMHVRVISKESPTEDAVRVNPSLEDLYLYFLNENRNGIIKEASS